MWRWCREMAKQADLQELVQTAIVTTLFGFMLAKLVSLVSSISGSMRQGNMRIERVPDDEEDEVVGVAEENNNSDDDDHSQSSDKGEIEFRKEIADEQTAAVAVDSSEEASKAIDAEVLEKPNRSGDELGIEAEDEGDNSDWEGVESTELDEAFGAASSYVATAAPALNVSNDMQLQLYALYKIATEGPCRSRQPSALKLAARAKWNAWQKLGEMSSEEAMERYIGLVCAISPHWTSHKMKKKGEETSSSTNTKQGGIGGPVFSTPVYEEEAFGNEGSLQALHAAAREGQEHTVIQLLNQGVFVDVKDSDGRTPLHWACDRGNLVIVELLISKGADIHAKDKEGQTALHYATTCEQEEVAKYLVDKGGDVNAKDEDGSSPFSSRPSTWIWMS